MVENRNYEWSTQSACLGVDPNIFFPENSAGVNVAKEICKTCVVRDICLEDALDQRIEHGVRGGTSERERRRILKARKTDVA